MNNTFFAYMSRLKHIRRWGLMRSFREENVAEHCHAVAVIAHALCVIHNERHAEAGVTLSPARAAEIAAFHEASEVITGDLATPIKYFNDDIRTAYKRIERIAEERLLGMLPGDLRPAYETLVNDPSSYPEWTHVKAADRIAAYLKCIEEKKSGNHEFDRALQAIREDIDKSPLPAVADFMRDFAPAYELTLDELN